MEYAVHALARLSGVSARTLRYYDQIGLLRPARVSAGGYRIYGAREVDRLAPGQRDAMVEEHRFVQHRRRQRFAFPLQHQLARGEQRALAPLQRAGQSRAINLGDMALGADHAVQQVAVVGQQQQARGLLVQPSDG